MRIFRLMLALLCLSGATALPASPAAAAIKITFSGYFDDPRYTEAYPAGYDFSYNYFYRPEEIVYECVAVFFAYCDRETVPLVAASGRIGDTRIPFHSINGTGFAEYDDPVAFSFRPVGDTQPYIAGSFVDYSWWLSRAPTSFEGGLPQSFQVHSPDGSVLQRAYLFNVTTSEVPEPATWLMLLAGFGAIGSAVRRSRARMKAAISFA